MQVVLTEIDCLDLLNKRGIYPDKYYTSFDIMKNHLVGLIGAEVIIILGGQCRFNKKHIVEFVKQLYSYQRDDSGVEASKVYFFTDIKIPSVGEYYFYVNDLFKVDKYRGWKCLETNNDIWGKLKSEPKQSEMFLSHFHTGDTDKELKQWNGRETTEDDIIPFIKKPNVLEMLKANK